MKKWMLIILATILGILLAMILCIIFPGIPMFIILVVLELCKIQNTISQYILTTFLFIWFAATIVLWIYLCKLSVRLIGAYLSGNPLSTILDKDKLICFLRRIFRFRKTPQLGEVGEPQEMIDANTDITTENDLVLNNNFEQDLDRYKKLRLIYLPVLLSSIAFITTYNLLFWLLVIKYKLLNTMDNITEFGLPLLLAVIPILFWHRLCIRLLDLENKKGDRRFGYMIVLWLIVASTNIFTQFAIEKANRGLTHLNKISDILITKPTQCYTIKNCYIGKNNDCIYHTTFLSGGELTLLGYVVYPIFSDPADTDIGNVDAWIGTKFLKPISSDLTKEQKNAEWDKFKLECIARARDTLMSKFLYLQKPDDKDNYDCYVNAVKECEPKGKKIVLLPVNEPFENDNGTLYATLAMVIFVLGALLWLPMFLMPAINKQELEIFLKGKQKQGLQRVFRFFLPKKGYYATPILLDINIAVYITMMIKGPEFAMLGFEREYLISWGANYAPLTMHGQWWRLLSCTFLHSGLMHIANNIVALMFAGLFFEKVIGAKKYFFVYLVTGVAGSAVSVWCHPIGVSVGASGAVMGIYGVYFALLFTNILPVVVFRGFFKIWSIIIVVGTLLVGLAPGVDNAAHLGGLVCGFILGFILRRYIEPFTDKDVDGLVSNFLQ